MSASFREIEMSILRQFIPDFSKFPKITKVHSKRLVNFSRFWRTTVIVTAGVSLIPLIIITIVDYNVTQQSIESEFLLRTSRIVSNTHRTISFFLKERRSSLNFIIHDNNFEQLKAPKRLTEILVNLKKGFGGFTDLGVIDARGRQINYVGPYPLRNKDYSGQEWYEHVVEEHVYISDVFLGYRKVPHMVIAVKHDLPDGDFFVLRASLDIEPFKSHLYDLELSGSGDAFVINHDGVLQTPSRHHGSVLKNVPLAVPDFSPKTEVFEETYSTGEALVIGYRYIEETPFILMIVKKKRELMKSWQKTRLELILFLAISIVLILAVILNRATHMINKIYAADERRVMALHEVEYANKMASIGRLASGVAHEINNPLAIINEKTGLIKDLFAFKQTYAHDEKLLGLVDSILSSVKRCGRITRRLLRFARYSDVHIEPVDLKEVIHDVLGFLEKEAEYRSIKVVVKDEEIPVFETDRGKLQQIFLNIINNAFAAMNDGGHLDIRTHKESNGFVTVTIRDNGCGIPAEDIDHIFEPFYSTKIGQGGTGLGLSITYGLVQELGGTITATSKEGEGTCFTIKLPLKTETKERMET